MTREEARRELLKNCLERLDYKIDFQTYSLCLYSFLFSGVSMYRGLQGNEDSHYLCLLFAFVLWGMALYSWQNLGTIKRAISYTE